MEWRVPEIVTTWVRYFSYYLNLFKINLTIYTKTITMYYGVYNICK